MSRAFDVLGLSHLGHLLNLPALRGRIAELKGEEAFPTATLREHIQAPLKQFSAFLYKLEITERDALDRWERIRLQERTRLRRALEPAEMVRALHAADAIATVRPARSGPEKNSLRMLWLTALVTAPRISSLLDRAKRRLVFPAGQGNKLTGAGSLDSKTFEELVRYVGDRTGGPQFLSPTARRPDRYRCLEVWRQTTSWAFVDLLWPEGEPMDHRESYLVSLSLLEGKIVSSLGGHVPPGPAKLRERNGRAERIGRVVESIREGWTARMQGVDVHGLRKTARTWAIRQQVAPALIDIQLGHMSERSRSTIQEVFSRTGDRHYLDRALLVNDASAVAEAVRRELDRAEAEFQNLSPGESVFVRNTIRNTSAAV